MHGIRVVKNIENRRPEFYDRRARVAVKVYGA